MKPIIFSLFAHQPIFDSVLTACTGETGTINIRQFPDGETYLQIVNDIKGRDVIVVASLDYPNDKIMPLLIFAQTAKELGAKRIGLIAPYLAYMRQDKRFNSGEAITSKTFAKLLSVDFDWMVTMDPHLHRYHSLDEIYTIPTAVTHATSAISQWIKQHIKNPALIGPDQESEQWVAEVANGAAAPYQIATKVRTGDRTVAVTIPDLSMFRTHTPVLVDDIISTAQTMMAVTKQFCENGINAPVCIGVHALFAGDAYKDLQHAGAHQIITCNTIAHPSNAIDIAKPIIEGLMQFILHQE